MKLITKTLLCLAIFLPSILFADVIYVNHAATGLNNGSNWQNAFTDLQNALNSTPIPDTIWVAQGTYYPTDGTDRDISYNLPNGVAIFGGFEGTETQLDQRDWETHQTILSGDIGEQGDHSDNSFTILYGTHTDTTTTLDGLIIKHGFANSDILADPTIGPRKCGGGLYLLGQGVGNFAAIKINNCRFLDNYASYYGGAIFLSGFSGSIDFNIMNSIFKNNESGNAGGAIGKRGTCNVIQNMEFCKFENNRSAVGGAYWTGEANVAIDLNIEHCEFIENNSGSGAAISRINYGVNSNDLNIFSCLFENNGFGNVIYDDNYNSTGDTYIEKCTFKNGGGKVISLFTSEPRALVIVDCNFIENKCECFGRLIEATNYHLYSINNLFLKNETNTGACIVGPASSKFINNTFCKNKALQEGTMIHHAGEVSVTNSIFWENEARLFSYFSSLDIDASIFDLDSCDSISIQNPSGINCQPDVLFHIDPLFRDTANLDFSLISCSPAINAGNTAIINSLGISEDLAGNDRVIDGIVDIGAFEQEAISANQDSVQNESCFGISNGVVYLNNSGNPPFDISWQSNGDSGMNTNYLAPGAYEFFITDADGCSDTLSVEIEAAEALTTTFDSIQHESCSGISNGAVYLSSSGVQPFDISWQSDNESGTNTTGLAPGGYDFTLIDADGCSDTLAVVIEAGTALMSNFDSIQHESCLENSNGAVYISSSGNPPFDIFWQSGNESGTNTSGLAPGVYDFVLIDAEGCSDTLNVEIEATTPLTINFDNIQHESCFGSSNGAVYINSSGNPPFDISWQSGSESGANTSGLSPGVYDFTVIDAEGCSDTLTVEIEAATALTTNFESNDASGSEIADGSIDFEVIAGGTPGYTYEWSTGATTASISDLLPGNYFLTVTDAINCRYGFAFYVGGLTGFDDLEAGNNFQIQPNPAHDFLIIKLENPLSEIHQFQLFDELGRLVLKNDLPFSQTEHQIYLEQIPAGFYHYSITNVHSLVKTGKLVVF